MVLTSMTEEYVEELIQKYADGIASEPGVRSQGAFLDAGTVRPIYPGRGTLLPNVSVHREQSGEGWIIP